MKKKIKRKIGSGIYQIGYQDPSTGKIEYPRKKYETYRLIERDGRRVAKAKCFATFAEAKEYHRSPIENQSEAHGLDFRRLWEKYMVTAKETLSLNTVQKLECQRVHLEFFAGLKVQEITPQVIDQWLSQVKAPDYLANQQSTRKSYLMEFRALRQVLRYYREEFDYRYAIPLLDRHRKMIKVREPMILAPKDLSLEEMRKFLNALTELTFGTDFEFLPVLAKAQYGIYGRIQEAAALRYEDVDFESGVIRLQGRIMYLRSGSSREVYVEGLKAGRFKDVPSMESVRLLREWAMKKGIRSGFLFTLNGNLVPYRAIQYRYDRAFKRAAIKRSGTHILRHASLSEHYATTGDIKLTSAAAGHRDLSTTEVYAKVRAESVSEAQKQMDKKLKSMMALDILG